MGLGEYVSVMPTGSELAQINESQARVGAMEGERMRARQKEKDSQTLKNLKMQGATDPNARNMATQLDPEYAKQLQDYEVKRANYWGNQAYAGLQAPIAQRPGIYTNLYGKAEAAGEDVSYFPIPPKNGEWTDFHQGTLEYLSNLRDTGKQSELPSNVRTFQAYKGMSPEDRRLFQEANRDPYKTLMTTDNSGNIVVMPGAAESKRELKYAESSGAAAGKTMGESEAKAQIDLPLVQDQSQYNLETLNKLENHPGLSDLVGVKGGGAIGQNIGIDKVLPGSKAANFQALFEQVQGTKFLEAFQSLKGGGAITEIEGVKATQAISRLKTAQSEKEFKEAIGELKTIVEQGLRRAQQKAKGNKSNNDFASTSSTNKNTPSTNTSQMITDWGDLK